MKKKLKEKTFLFLLILLTTISNWSIAQVSPCTGFTTYTQGGWGSNPKGNNPGTILENNFKSVFPFGLTIGSINKISFTSASAVRAFLPQGGTAKRLNAGTLINPTKSTFSSVLAGQLVAATINVQFDKHLPNFGASLTKLKDLKVSVAPFFNMSIEEVVAEANSFIGGISSTYSANDFNTILTKINEGYDNGITSNSIFACPITFNTSSINVKCTGESNGVISISDVTGGAGAPYTYKLNGYSVYLPINTLAAGVYTLEVFDRIGLSAKKTIVISEPALLIANSNANAILCKGGKTDVVVSAQGGTAPYTGTGTFNVSAGRYSYTVTDANGCTATTDITITEPTLLTASSIANAILCNGGKTDVVVSAQGGTAPYTGTGTFNVSAGTYSYTVTDVNGCTATTDITITEPSLLSLSGTVQNDTSCNGGTASGIATVSVQGGQIPYTYLWSNGTSGTNVLTGLTYNALLSVTVTDANGCSSLFAFDTVKCVKQNNEDDEDDEDDDNCIALRTYTQGGWGAVPSGNNPGTYLHANFATAFPNGLTIGNGTNNIILTTATAVTNFLPSGGSLNTLTGSSTNPGGTISSTFAGQLVAATLNVGFDTYFANFAAGTNSLKDMYCNFSGFYGVKVSDLLIEANASISGSTTTHSRSSLNSALTKLNENYDNGNEDNGDFVCEVADMNISAVTSQVKNEKTISIYPNPVKNYLNLDVKVEQSQKVTVNIIALNGQVLIKEVFYTEAGLNTLILNLTGFTLLLQSVIVEVITIDTIERNVVLIQ